MTSSLQRGARHGSWRNSHYEKLTFSLEPSRRPPDDAAEWNNYTLSHLNSKDPATDYKSEICKTFFPPALPLHARMYDGGGGTDSENSV